MNNKLREAIEGGIIIPEAQAFALAETTDHVFSHEYTRKTEKLIKDIISCDEILLLKLNKA